MVEVSDVPDVSLVFEFENARYLDDGQQQRLVATLSSQITAAPWSVEVLLAEDAPAIEDWFRPVPVRRYDVDPDASYYELKSAGARAARAPIVVFADSDAIAVPGWLEEILAPLAETNVDAVTGTTSIRPLRSVWDKTFAATSWFAPGPGIEQHQLYANNLAVRREVFLPRGFPPIGCRYRGSCEDLFQAWRKEGIRLVTNPAAHMEHAPPHHPVRRAIWAGHDLLLAGSRPPWPTLLARVVGHQLLAGTSRIVRNRRIVGLRRREVPLALAYNVRESMARGVGVMLTRFRHRAVHRLAL